MRKEWSLPSQAPRDASAESHLLCEECGQFVPELELAEEESALGGTDAVRIEASWFQLHFAQHGGQNQQTAKSTQHTHEQHSLGAKAAGYQYCRLLRNPAWQLC